MTKSRVFVGPGNIAGFAMSVAKSLRKVGIQARSFSYVAHPFGYECDFDNILITKPLKGRSLFQKIFVNKYTLKIIWFVQKLLLLTYSVIIYDTFIFISTDTFFSNNIDLKLLKLFKKKIAFVFVGCPERDPEDYINKLSKGICYNCSDMNMQTYLNCYNSNKKKKKIEYISEFAEVIFAHRDSTSYILDIKKVKFVFVISELKIKTNEILEKYNHINEITITHLPTNSLLKGTTAVFTAINELRLKGYKINFISKRVRHSEIGSLLKDTHILIDQFSGSHGQLSVEAMANGCVVVCKISDWFRKDFPELPLVSCNPDQLSGVIEELIKDREKMLSIAVKSFDYYQKYHTLEVVGNYYKENLKLN